MLSSIFICTTHSLYWYKLWQQDLCQYPQNANLDGSMREDTAQRIGRPFGGNGVEGHHQENPDQGVNRKGPGNHWWNSPASYSADCQRFRHLTHNCECMCEERLEPDGLLRLVIRREYHQHDLPHHQSQPDRRPSTEYSLSSCRRLWKRHAPSSESASRRWLRLKAATLNRC